MSIEKAIHATEARLSRLKQAHVRMGRIAYFSSRWAEDEDGAYVLDLRSGVAEKANYPSGSWVQLSKDEMAEVRKIVERALLRMRAEVDAIVSDESA